MVDNTAKTAYLAVFSYSILDHDEDQLQLPGAVDLAAEIMRLGSQIGMHNEKQCCGSGMFIPDTNFYPFLLTCLLEV
jgi:hypothetical protein